MSFGLSQFYTLVKCLLIFQLCEDGARMIGGNSASSLSEKHGIGGVSVAADIS